jgi:periplasmic protein TonB
MNVVTSQEDAMFADSLLDSAWAHDSRRGWTTALSFAVQGLAVGVLLLLPLIYGEGLPGLQWTQVLVAPTPPPPPVAPMQAQHTPSVSNLAADGRPFQPRSIPLTVAQITDEVAPPPVGDVIGVVGSTNDHWSSNPVMHAILSTVPGVLPPPVHPSIARPRLTSHIMEGNLIRKVQPEYPALARQARIQGAVVLQAIISREGTIENLQVLSGHPMLAPSALAAVGQWRYRPYFLNGEPVEVETQVTVNFVLGGG